jgi:hypothetical protein
MKSEPRFHSLTHESKAMDKNNPALPARKAFILQLRAEAQVEHGHFKGRVEHIVSHQSAHFESLEELLAFIVRIVMEQQQP